MRRVIASRGTSKRRRTPALGAVRVLARCGTLVREIWLAAVRADKKVRAAMCGKCYLSRNHRRKCGERINRNKPKLGRVARRVTEA